jgi:hypothetical protein
MIGHALRLPPRPEASLDWDRWIAAGFAVGSLGFFIGPFPGFVQLVGQAADSVVFFAGSIFFTVAAGLELREATLRQGRRFGDATWWGAAVQFAGTLLFNISTFNAMLSGLSTHQTNRLVWAPDLFGSACFLVSGVLGYAVVRRAAHDTDWIMAVVNLTGCVLFGVAAIASFVLPSTGSVLALAPMNWGTGLGALCFLAGALLLWHEAHARRVAHAR